MKPFCLLFLFVSPLMAQQTVGLPGISSNHKAFLNEVVSPAGSDFECPEGAFKLDIKFSSTNQRKIWCQKSSGAGYINHGWEKIYDQNGKLVSQTLYEEGKQIPGNKAAAETSGREKSEVVQATKKVFSTLMKGMIPLKRGKFTPDEDFQVSKCKINRLNFLKFLMTKRGFNDQFTFAPGCDVQGPFSPQMGSPFPVDLELRKIGKFSRVKMSVTILIDMVEGGGLQAVITAEDGILFAPEGEVSFTGDYKLDLQMNPSHPVKNNRGGSVKVVKAFGEPVNVTEKFKIHF